MADAHRPSCPVCKADQTRFWFTKNRCDLYRCQACKLIFPHPLPTDTASLYSEQYFSGGEQGFGYAHYDEDFSVDNPTFTSYLALIGQYYPATGRLLDIGAATGTFLATAKNRGWNVTGLEISAYAAEQGRKKGLTVLTGSIEDYPFSSSETFDVVTMWDVLEHVPHPHKTLEAIAGRVKPGGLLVLNLPDAGSFYARALGKFWPLIVPPEHICLFRRENLTKLLTEHGFAVLETKKVGKKFRLAYIFQVLYTLRYQKIWKTLADRIRRTRLNAIAIPLNLRDNLFVIARKQ